MRDTRSMDLEALRRSSAEWRRRGLTPPDAIAAMVAERVAGPSDNPFLGGDPAYADFFSEEGVA